MSDMTDERAAEVLAAHNEWRRFNGKTGVPGAPVMGDVKELGRAIDHAVSRLRSQPPAEAQIPSYDALLIIAQSVCGALARAGIEDCDDPGEAIDVMRERLEQRIADLSKPPSAPVSVEWSVIIEGLRLADQFFDGDTNHWQWDDGEFFPADKVRSAYKASLAAQETNHEQ